MSDKYDSYLLIMRAADQHFDVRYKCLLPIYRQRIEGTGCNNSCTVQDAKLAIETVAGREMRNVRR